MEPYHLVCGATCGSWTSPMYRMQHTLVLDLSAACSMCMQCIGLYLTHMLHVACRASPRHVLHTSSALGWLCVGSRASLGQACILVHCVRSIIQEWFVVGAVYSVPDWPLHCVQCIPQTGVRACCMQGWS